MSNPAFTETENEIIDFDFTGVKAEIAAFKSNVANIESASSLKSEICSIWSKIGPIIKKFKALPIIGHYISVIAALLDALCG